MANREKILIVDDDPAQGTTLARVLELEGYQTSVAEGGREALREIDETNFDLLLTDLKMPGMDGMELFREVQARRPDLPVIIVTAHGTIESAIGAVREGVVDFVQKPVFADELMHRFHSVFREKRLRDENAELKSALLHRDRGDAMLGTSEAMTTLREQISRVAKTDASVLVLGESGTGKELIADAIHYGSSRAHGPLVKLNCAAIPENLLEDELFGHERGAFTGADQRRIGRFEQADGGTLFLDEIGDMPLAAQAKVLRALETHEVMRVGDSKTIGVDIRVVAATNADLSTAVEEKTFRLDLFYRLNVVPLHVPALRDRREDLPQLAEHFLERLATRTGRRPRSLSSTALARLASFDFPGNVRQLKNLIEGADVFAEGPEIGLQEVEQILAGGPAIAVPASTGTGSAEDPFRAETFESFKDQSEALFFRRKLDENDGNVKRTAERLGMQRSHLYKKLDRYRLRG